MSIDFKEWRPFFDSFIHERLSKIRLVPFVMPITPIAYQVDNHIFSEFHAVVTGKFGDVNEGFRILPMDMENGHHEHFG